MVTATAVGTGGSIEIAQEMRIRIDGDSSAVISLSFTASVVLPQLGSSVKTIIGSNSLPLQVGQLILRDTGYFAKAGSGPVDLLLDIFDDETSIPDPLSVFSSITYAGNQIKPWLQANPVKFISGPFSPFDSSLELTNSLAPVQLPDWLGNLDLTLTSEGLIVQDAAAPNKKAVFVDPSGDGFHLSTSNTSPTNYTVKCDATFKNRTQRTNGWYLHLQSTLGILSVKLVGTDWPEGKNIMIESAKTIVEFTEQGRPGVFIHSSYPTVTLSTPGIIIDEILSSTATFTARSAAEPVDTVAVKELTAESVRASGIKIVVGHVGGLSEWDSSIEVRHSFTEPGLSSNGNHPSSRPPLVFARDAFVDVATKDGVVFVDASQFPDSPHFLSLSGALPSFTKAVNTVPLVCAKDLDCGKFEVLQKNRPWYTDPDYLFIEPGAQLCMNFADYYPSSNGSDDAAIRCVGLRLKNREFKKHETSDSVRWFSDLARNDSEFVSTYPVHQLEGLTIRPDNSSTPEVSDVLGLTFDENSPALGHLAVSVDFTDYPGRPSLR
jgi:hypothetical protein